MFMSSYGLKAAEIFNKACAVVSFFHSERDEGGVAARTGSAVGGEM
jgi:hypothetical protein